MLTYLESDQQQLPLIHIVDEAEQILLSGGENEWYRILHDFPWNEYPYREMGARYYDALMDFNIKEAKKREAAGEKEGAVNPETQEEAQQRLLFDRTTMDGFTGKKSKILFEGVEMDLSQPLKTNPADIAPGKIPYRLAGKNPKCFFALFKSFMGVSLMGFEPEPDMVHTLLGTNPAFAQVCGFVPKRDENEPYHFKQVPSLRKLQQFDAIMRDYGIWDQMKWEEVKKNLKEKVIQIEPELVADTTHYYAYSGFKTVTYLDEKGEEQKKSQSKVTKSCHCSDWEMCPHPWILADDGAGSVCKSNHKIYWAHKASLIAFTKQGVILDAVAVQDSASSDKVTILPQMERLFDHLPCLESEINRLLYDSSGDSKDLKEQFKSKWNIDLKTSQNPRGKKEITLDLPKGIQKITPYGVPVCLAGFDMEYKGIRWDQEKFIYQAPFKNQQSVCLSCSERLLCCPNALQGRVLTLSFDVLPHINPNDPPMSKRFKAMMKKRPIIERLIKQLKLDRGSDQLTKRGNASFQAYLDKTMIAYHILLRS